MKEKAAARQSGHQDRRPHSNRSTSLEARGKLNRMFCNFAKGKRYNRFSAERAGDHCLPTTISDLQRKHGIYFSRRFIKVPNRFYSETRVNLYWLEGDSLIKAREICGLGVCHE